MLKTFKTMFITELKLSIRDMNMIIFGLCMPLIIIIVIGIIYGTKPAFEGANYTFLQQSFGAISTIAICGGGTMGLPIVIANYRHRKILKRFRVTPISPMMILMVQSCIHMLYALVSLILLFTTASMFFGYQLKGSIIHFLGAYLMVILSIFSIGLAVGGMAKNLKSATAITSLIYFPMLLFSGATLPYEIMPVPLQRIADVLPLTQGIKLLKTTSLGMKSEMLPLLSMLVTAIIFTTLAVKYFKWE